MTNPAKVRANPIHLTLLLLALFPVFLSVYAWLVGVAPVQDFNSDFVQPYMYVRDALIDPGLLASWHMQAANYIFPDHLIALILVLAHVDPVHSMLINGAILAVLLSLASGYLLHSAGVADLTRATFVAALALLGAILVGLALPGDMASHMQIWTITTFVHSGALVCGVAAIGLWTAAEMQETRRPGLFWLSLALATLAGYSDLSFGALFAVPIAIATALAFFATHERGRLLRGIVFATTAIGFFLLDLLARTGTRTGSGGATAGGDDSGDVAITAAASLLDGFFDHMVLAWEVLIGAALSDPLLALFLLATPFMAARAAYLILRSLKNRQMPASDFIEIALTGTQTATLLLAVLFGMIHETWGLRYTLPICVLPLLWVLVLARRWLSRPLRLRAPWAWAAGLWTIALAASLPAGLAALPGLTATPPIVACMQEIGVETAYAWYWNAKSPMFLSDYAVNIVQIEPDGTRSHWNVNDAWMTRSIVDGQPFTVRTIDMSGLDRQNVTRIYGPPSGSHSCGGIELWLYDKDLPLPPERH